MSEKPVAIPVEGGAITLEGLFEEGRIGRTAIVCHPHPLHGGDMYNNVVEAAREAFAGLGWGTLRFNFRGAGSSGGQAAQGQQDAADLVAISEFIRAKSPGPVDLASYSYGTWVTMEAVRMGLRPDSLILISPPLDFIVFEGLKLPEAPTLTVIGDKDEFCSLQSLRNWLSLQAPAGMPDMEVLGGTHHFYWGAERRLCAKITDFLKAKVLFDKTGEPSG
jgi:hypothetical protein